MPTDSELRVQTDLDRMRCRVPLRMVGSVVPTKLVIVCAVAAMLAPGLLYTSFVGFVWFNLVVASVLVLAMAYRRRVFAEVELDRDVLRIREVGTFGVTASHEFALEAIQGIEIMGRELVLEVAGPTPIVISTNASRESLDWLLNQVRRATDARRARLGRGPDELPSALRALRERQPS